jgi:hypothetical protein
MYLLLPDPFLRRVTPFQHNDGAIHHCLAHPYPSWETCVSIRTDRTTLAEGASRALAGWITARD